MTVLRDSGNGHPHWQDSRATIRLSIDFGDTIPGRPILKDWLSFDGTPDGFNRALEALRVAFHAEAESPLRPCGHPGPWHRGA